MLVLDFGAQYAQLIARRVRECRVRSELVPHDITPDEVLARNPYGLILSGGPASIYADGAPRSIRACSTSASRCWASATACRRWRTRSAARSPARAAAEFGKTELDVRGGVLLHDVGEVDSCWMSHNDAVVRAPDGFGVTASTPSTPVAAMEDPERGLYAVQFHPEVQHTPRGTDMLKNFLTRACHAPATWTALAVIDEQVELIRAQVGDAGVVCGLSGGVDSAVAALLVHRAVGEQLTCVFVDHGLLRAGEAEQVVETFGDHFQVPLVHVEASERFLSQLAGVTDPETKRMRIGETFIRVFEEESRKLDGRPLPRAGHALLRRDRVRLADRGQDQVAPQRRRPARRHRLRAVRAAALAVQGRGAARRRGARPARRDRLAPAVPGPGPRDPHHRRGHVRSGSRSCATPMR